ncbi:reverse transcriptase domain-containing protein [Tanacetum coccineum]
MDQEKTTFTCPFGTYAYRRMPFGLCNAPAFQRCMLAIFHDMIKEYVEVLMDDFSIFGNSFDNCLYNLDKILQRCKDANLVLNWETCHFMVKEGIVLGHKVSGPGLEVDKAKINVISKIPPPINVKGIRNFGNLRFLPRNKIQTRYRKCCRRSLSRIENDETSEDDDEVDVNYLGETLMEISTRDIPCRVKKLEKKNRSRTHRLKRLYKVGLTVRVESSGDEESLGDDEVFVAEVVEVINTTMLIIDVAQVSAAGDIVSTTGAATTFSDATTTTATIKTVDDITLAQALEEMKSIKPKKERVVYTKMKE